MKTAVNKKRGFFALRAFALAFAFLVFFMHSVSFAASEYIPAKDKKKHRPFKPAEVTQIDLPVQRKDIFAGSIECMSSAASAALIEASSGQMLLASNQSAHLPMASTTKIITALITLERCDPDEVVTVAKEAAYVGGSCLWVDPGEKLTVRDLLYGLMLRSGNDAAAALAIHIGGSIEGFAEIMNERARLMGLENSNFVSPNGLDRDGHYSSAYDLCVIAANALKLPEFREIVTTQYYTIQTDKRTIHVKNKNTLLWDYDGCAGVKTGYTRKSGRCLVFAAERDGMLLVGCVLNCRPMFEVATEMLDFGFQNYEMAKAVNAGTELSRCVVNNGVSEFLPLVAKEDIAVLMKKGSALNVEVGITLDKTVYAPVFEGETVGECELLIDGCSVGKTPLTAGCSVSVRSYSFYLKHLLSLFTRG